MNENERWHAVLEAHRMEHEAMRERGLGRVSVFGRPRGMGATMQMPEMFSPYSLHQVNLSPYEGLGYILPPLPPVRTFDRPGPRAYGRRPGPKRRPKRRRPLRRRPPRRRLGALDEQQKTNALGVAAVVAALGAVLWFGFNAT